MHVIKLVVAALLANAFSWSAAATPVSPSELKQLFHRYESLKQLSVDFEQTKVLKDVPTPLKSTGHLMVKTPNELVWTIRKPAFLEVKMKAGNVEITSGEGPTADVQKISKEQMAANPQSRSLESLTHWLQFDANYLKNEYTVEKISNSHYSFKPNGDSPFTLLKVELGPEDVVKTVELSETSGDSLMIKFQKPTIQKLGAKK